ncbi:MAG: UDP-glucose/GDP-mannose dehydrogenase family protein [Patescibacteria group bacterium]
MKLCVIGTGYVGLVSAACFAEIGHDVIGVDIDATKIEKLKKGECPIYEPGLPELLEKHLKTGKISFTTNLDEAIRSAPLIMAAVGTPLGEGRRADLSQVESVCRTIGKHTEGEKVFVMKSTVPVGTSEHCRIWVEEEMLARRSLGEGGSKRGVTHHVHLVSNPEFLREGKAVKDFLKPDRIVVGFRDEKAGAMMRKLYEPLIREGVKYVEMSVESAELTKYASNAFLATKISFINFIAQLCEVCGANVEDVAHGMGLDNRIAPAFLLAGIGYGGSCFPKDVQALIKTAEAHGVSAQLLRDVEAINEWQRESFVRSIEKTLGGIRGKTFAVWGLSFKPDTDDMRHAPSVDIVTLILDKGGKVQAFDPVAMESARKILPAAVTLVSGDAEALNDADALLILTEWKHWKEWKAEEIAKRMKGKYIFDGRNVFEPEAMKAAGLQYVSIGRPS